MRNSRSWIAALGAALAFTSLASQAAESQQVSVGRGVMQAHFDKATGRVFAAVSGDRGGGGTAIGVIEADGRVRLVPLQGTMSDVALDTTRRKGVAALGTSAAVFDLDTLAASPFAVGGRTVRALIDEKAGRAYVVGQINFTGPIWETNGQNSGALTEIDLATGTTRIHAIPGIMPTDMALDAEARRIYIVGTNYFRTGETQPGFVNAFDLATASLVGAPVRLHRAVRDVRVSRDGKELFVRGFVDQLRPEFGANDPRRNGIRGAVFVLDAATLEAKRQIVLPEPKDVLTGGTMARMDHDPATDRLFVHDLYDRFLVVDPIAGSVRPVDLEAWARAIAYNPVSDKVIVAYPDQGYAGVFSPDGRRLDTLPMGPVSVPLGGFAYSVGVNPIDGTAYVPNLQGGNLAILRGSASNKADDVLNVTDLWWNPAESGWGVYVEQQGVKVFAALFVRDADGRPAWYVMSDGRRQDDGSFAGALYRTSGPAADALRNVVQAGTMRLAPSADGRATLSYDIGGVAHQAPLQRQALTAAKQACPWRAALDASPLRNFTSLWFDPAQPGWGLALSQQGATAFGVLFTYDAQNRPTWAVMSNGAQQGDGSFRGALYRHSADKGLQVAGSMALAFNAKAAAVLGYDLDGIAATRHIERQTFSPLVSDCGT